MYFVSFMKFHYHNHTSAQNDTKALLLHGYGLYYVYMEVATEKRISSQTLIKELILWLAAWHTINLTMLSIWLKMSPADFIIH